MTKANTSFVKNPLVLVFLFCLAGYAPFCGKPLHMDSPVTVYVAQQMLHDAWNPPLGHYGKLLSFWNHTDLPESSAFYATPHPPLAPLYCACFVKLFGENEIALNCAMFPFFFLSAMFFFLLAKQFLPRWHTAATLLFAASPAVFVNAQNVMLDVPLMMFCMAAFFFMFRSSASADAFLAGLFCGLACLTKFTGGTVALSGLLFYVLSRRWKNCYLFLFPIVMLYGLWMGHNFIVWGKDQLLANGHAHYLFGDIRYRYERLLSYAGGAIVLPVFPLLFFLYAKKFRTATFAAMLAAGGWSVLLWSHLHYSMASAAIYAVCATAGIMIVIGTLDFLLTGRSKPQGISLTTHVALQILGGGFLTLFATRYLLPAAFPMVLFVSSAIDGLGDKFPKKFIWATLICSSAAFSALLSVSDFQFVNAERRVAADVRSKFPDKKVFFSGRLGYLYYADKAGFASLLTEAPRAGDFLLRNTASHDDDRFFTDTARLQPVGVFHYPMAPLRAMTGRAGFYGDDRLPYAWVASPKDRTFLLYRDVGSAPSTAIPQAQK